MTLASLAIQLLNGLASASASFLVAAGLTLIFGVTRIVNFAHGSLFMLGAYLAYSLGGAWAEASGAGSLAFWGGALTAALCVAILGALTATRVIESVTTSVPKICSGRVRRDSPAQSRCWATRSPNTIFS